MRPDVAMISPYPGPGGTCSSGVGWYTQSLARHMADAGARVAVIAPQEPREPAAPGVQRDGKVVVQRLFERGPSGLARATAGALATGAPLVHVQHETFLYGGPSSIPALVPGLARLRVAGAGPVVTMHQVVDPAAVDQSFTEVHRVRIPARAARAGLAFVQATVSNLAQATIVHEPSFQTTIKGAVVLPLGGIEGTATDRGGDIRAEWGIDADDFVVLCFGFVAPYKGLETVLEAGEIAGPKVVTVVAGGEHPRLVGHDYIGSLQARFGPPARFTGHVPDEDVAGWFRDADVVVLAYRQGFASSGVLAQALAFDRPVLVSPAVARVHGAPPELVVDLDAEQLADRLRGLAADGSGLEQLRAAGRPLRTGRSWPELAHRHLDLYEEVQHAQGRTGRRGRH